MKRIISILLVLAIMLTLVPTICFAAMGDYGGNITGATWYWPLHGYSSTSSAYSKITSSYGYRGGSYQAYHKGMDIGASKGTAVYPTRNGTISEIHNSTSGSYGRYIIINHNDGYFSVYMHLSRIDVSKGQSVTVNTQIGAVGGSGFGSETGYAYHLHMGIHYGSSFNFVCNVNPCPSGYTRIGDSLQESAGGKPVGSASISYSVDTSAPSEPVDYTPGKPALKSMKSVYHTSENISFTWNATVNTTHYNLYVYQKNSNGEWKQCDRVDLANSGIARSYVAGEYRVLLESKNSNYWNADRTDWLSTFSDSYYFTVFDTPDKPALKNMKTVYHTSESISFLWDATANTTHYNIYLQSSGNGEAYWYYENIFYAESGVSRKLPAGKYRVLLESKNSNYRNADGTDWLSTFSDSYYFTVFDTPDKPALRNIKAVYHTSEKISFVWNATANTTHYNLYVYRKGSNDEWVQCDRVDYAEVGITRSYGVGEYRVQLESKNSNYWNADRTDWLSTFSDSYYFTVFDTPDKPALKNMKIAYQESESISFSWDATANTTHHNLYVYRKGSNDEWVQCDQVDYAESGVTRAYAAGEYRVLLEAKNSNYWNTDGTDWLSAFSDYYYFEVIEANPDVTLSTVNGAQIRTSGVQGMRFISSIDKTAADFSRVVEFGTVLIPSADITDISELQIGATLNGHAVAKVAAKNLYEVTDSKITFTAVITNIAEKNYAREYTARAYAILDDGSVVYSDTGASRSIYAVAQRGLENASESAENKALFQAIIDAVENA